MCSLTMYIINTLHAGKVMDIEDASEGSRNALYFISCMDGDVKQAKDIETHWCCFVRTKGYIVRK